MNQHEPNGSHDEEEERNVWWVSANDVDGFYSIVGLFFLFGFICPPLWWIGSFWPKDVKEKGGKMADRWQKMNRMMSIVFGTLLILALIIAGVFYAKTKDRSSY